MTWQGCADEPAREVCRARIACWYDDGRPMTNALNATRGRWCVRGAEREDYEAIVDLHLAVQALHHRAEPSRYCPPSREEVEEEVAKRMRERRAQYLVATDASGRAAGYLRMVFVRPHETPFAPAVSYVEIDEISVARKQQRRGVARALCEEAARRARASGRSVLRLSVRQVNADALAAYRALGYRTVSQRMELVLPEEGPEPTSTVSTGED